MADSTLGERIREAREALGLTQDDIASHFKISRNAVSLWESGDAKPAAEKYPQLADFLEVDLDWLLRAAGVGPIKRAGKPSEARRRPLIVPGGDLVRDRDLPVYAAAMAGAGHLIVTFDPIEWVKRPDRLDRVPSGYGIQVVGESMIPVYHPGDLVLVHPHLPPERGKNAVFYHVPPSNEAEAMIKQIVSWNDTHWKLRQFNPLREFTELRSKWQVAHRVVGSYDRR